jgi:hypothetical protein
VRRRIGGKKGRVTTGREEFTDFLDVDLESFDKLSLGWRKDYCNEEQWG